MNRKYDDEFKRQAVQKVFDGQSVASVSRELGVNEGLIHKWKRATLENSAGYRTGNSVKRSGGIEKADS